MDINIIDLPRHLRPATFLPDIEDELEGRSKEVVDLCKDSECDDRDFIEDMARKAERLWVEHGDPLGHAIAFLWLADLYWRNRNPKDTLSYSLRSVEHMPDGRAPTRTNLQSAGRSQIGRPSSLLPVSTTTKAAAHYLLGLSRHMLGRMSEAFDAYQETFELFQATEGYWRRVGGAGQVTFYKDILKWIKRLKEYGQLRLAPLDGPVSNRILTYPVRSNAQDNGYLLLELELKHTINANDIGGAVRKFLLDDERAQPWYCDKDKPIDGYVIGEGLRVLGLTSTPRPATLHGLNPDARLDEELVLPSGATYDAYQITEEQLALPDKGIYPGDWLLVCSTAPLDLRLVALLWRRANEEIAFGEFVRSQGQVQLKEIIKPPRFVGKPVSYFDRIGNPDFVLRPA